MSQIKNKTSLGECAQPGVLRKIKSENRSQPLLLSTFFGGKKYKIFHNRKTSKMHARKRSLMAKPPLEKFLNMLLTGP